MLTCFKVAGLCSRAKAVCSYGGDRGLVSLTDFRVGYFKALNLSFPLKDVVPHIYVAILSLK